MSFDIDHYAQTSTRVRWDDLDMSSFEDQPLSEDALRCLSYMSDVETHTVCYLRDLLVTPSHADPEVTVFLTMWNLEEYWHGEVLDEVLERHGVPTGPEHTRAVRSRLGWRDRLAPIRQSLLANIIGEDPSPATARDHSKDCLQSTRDGLAAQRAHADGCAVDAGWLSVDADGCGRPARPTRRATRRA